MNAALIEFAFSQDWGALQLDVLVTNSYTIAPRSYLSAPTNNDRSNRSLARTYSSIAVNNDRLSGNAKPGQYNSEPII